MIPGAESAFCNRITTPCDHRRRAVGRRGQARVRKSFSIFSMDIGGSSPLWLAAAQA
jgi:hypothetical protein